jgi:hypothetical protein
MRCPVCKANNVQGPSCRRCKADLGLLFALESRRARELADGRRALAEGRFSEAAEHAVRAEDLRGDDDARRLRALAHLLDRDYPAAWECYRAVANASPIDEPRPLGTGTSTAP